MALKKQGLVLALLCMAGAIAMRFLAPGDLLLYSLALPFDLAAKGLRALSLGSGAGNALAWALYFLLCFLPLLQGFWRKKQGREARHWGMRALLSVGLLYSLYLFINPADFRSTLGPMADGEGLLICKIMLAGAVWSLGLAWWAVVMLGRAERLALYDGLALLLKITGALLIVSLFYSKLYALTGCLRPTGVQVYGESGVALTGLAGVAMPGMGFSPYTLDLPRLARIAGEALPAVFLLLLVSPGLALLGALRQNPYGEEVAALCNKVAEKARAAVYACVAGMVGANFLQLFLAGKEGGASVHIGLDIPLVELALAIMLLLLAEGSRRNRALKLDSDSII